MAVHLVRRKRTFTIIFVMCFIAGFVLYNRREPEAPNLNIARENQRDDSSRSGISVANDEETVPTALFLPVRTYSVVAIDVKDTQEEELEHERSEEKVEEGKKQEMEEKMDEEVDGVQVDKNPKQKASSKTKNDNGDYKDDKNVIKDKSVAGGNVYNHKEQTDERKGDELDKTGVEGGGQLNKLEKQVDGNGELENRTKAKGGGLRNENGDGKIVRIESEEQRKENGGRDSRENENRKKGHEDGSEGKENQDIKKTGGRLGGKINVTLIGQKSRGEVEHERKEFLRNNTLPKLSPSSHLIIRETFGKTKQFLTSNEDKNSQKTRNNSAQSSNQVNFASNTNNTSTPARMTNWASDAAKLNNPRLKKIRRSKTQRPRTTWGVHHDHEKTTVLSREEPLACKVPLLDPFHPLVSPLIHDVGTDLRTRCRSMYPRTPSFSVVNNKLVLRAGINPTRVSKDSITFREIRRQGDSEIIYQKEKKPFRGLKSILRSKDIGKSDFFRVYYEIDGKNESDLHARIARRDDILEKQTKKMKAFQGKGLPLNVLVIGFDSTSTANFVRKMGRVISFLKTQLHTYFMNGMSIIGDGTTPILTALLSGKRESELPEGRTSYGGNPIDDWPWIMKDYEKQGYMTLYAEDDPSVSSFNLRLQGFKQSPAHHYMRPFWLSLERERERDEPGLCSKSESMTNLTLKYLESFFDAYPMARKFAFGFMSYLTHAHPNHISYAENDLLQFLRTFVNKGYHKDTMVIIMGDHGSRNAEYRDTVQGKLEERLPWFSVSLPSSFHRRFGDLAANLRSNQAIITSAFDVHATLRHILTYPNIPSDERTRSLLQKLPRSRTCNNAGIAEHWCPCLKWLPVNVTFEEVRRIASAAVDHINSELSKIPLLRDSCHHLKLDSVQDAVTLQANIKVQEFDSTDQDGDRSVRFGEKTTDYKRYQVIFTTQPNNGKYEATGVSTAELVKVNPEISRINRYNNQPKCIAKQYPYARKFCFCRYLA